MACRGVHFALSSEEQLKMAELTKSQGNVVEYIEEEIEDRWDCDWLCETDKAWDAIHRCLTDGLLSFDDATPLHWCVLGGIPMHNEDDYIISFVDEEKVKAVANALDIFTEVNFREKYDAIDASDYGMELSDEDFEYTWENFQDLRTFYRKAASADRSVIFTVDQ